LLAKKGGKEGIRGNGGGGEVRAGSQGAGRISRGGSGFAPGLKGLFHKMDLEASVGKRSRKKLKCRIYKGLRSWGEAGVGVWGSLLYGNREKGEREWGASGGSRAKPRAYDHPALCLTGKEWGVNWAGAAGREGKSGQVLRRGTGSGGVEGKDGHFTTLCGEERRVWFNGRKGIWQ